MKHDNNKKTDIIDERRNKEIIQQRALPKEANSSAEKYQGQEDTPFPKK